MTEIAARIVRPIQRLNPWKALGLLLALLVAAGGSLALGRALALRDAVLPGVTVAGVDVGGLERSAARARLAAALGGRLAAPVRVEAGGDSFSIRPDAVLELDAAATERLAFKAGRESFLSRLAAAVLPFGRERAVAPVLRLGAEGRPLLARRLERVGRGPVSARVAMEGLRPVVVPGRAGARVDVAALVASLRAAGLGGRGEVAARIWRVEPAITTAEAGRAADAAETVVSAAVTLTFEGETLGQLPRSRLARLVRFQPAGGGYEVVLAGDALARALAPMIAPETTEAVDASFEVVGKRVRVVRSQGGTRLAPTKAREAVLAAALATGARTAELELTKLEADLTTREAKELGIRGQISTFTTDMGVSSANRIHNVHLLGRYLDGTILRPGEKFSFNRVLGPRTPGRGFLEGQMIFAGVLIPAIGGGVCQTATTIFNAAFEAGLPISQRKNHSFYISHYPLGRDATVSWDGPDLVFRNDLDNAILIKARYTDETFTVTFYGTDEGRKVVARTSEPTHYTAPRLQYAIDPSARRGSLRFAAGGAPGFDVKVHRKVYEDGKLIREDDFFTRYTPQNPTAIYGPGKRPPGPAFVLPTG